MAVGCRFTEVMTGFHKMHVPETVINIDIDCVMHRYLERDGVSIDADAGEALRRILERPAREGPQHLGRHLDASEAGHAEAAEWLIDVLRAELPDDAVVFTDASEMAYRMHTDFPAYGPRSFFYPSNYIALGWGFPAAIGALAAQRWRAPCER